MIKTDPEFQSVIPPLTDEERGELEKSILAEGCRDALVLWGDILLDGHNRLEICRKHGTDYQTAQMDFESRDAALEWILRNQLARRNLDAVQRSRLALRMKEAIAAQAKERQREHGGTAPGKQKQEAETLVQKSAEVNKETREAIAEIAGVSHDTIHKVETVDASAPEPVKKAMESGVISISKAYEATKAAEKNAAVKQRLEAVPDDQVAGAIQQAFAEYDDERERRNKIMHLWSRLHTLDYTDRDYDAWLGRFGPEALTTQEEIVDSAMSNLIQIQRRVHEICRKKRMLRLAE